MHIKKNVFDNIFNTIIVVTHFWVPTKQKKNENEKIQKYIKK